MVRLPHCLVFGLLLVGLLEGCSTLNSRIAQVTGLQAAKDKEIAALKASFDSQLDQKTRKLAAANAAALKTLQDSLGGAVDAFYGQGLVFQTILTPTRTDLVTHNLAEEGWTALGHGMPSYDAMTKMNERLKGDLDVTKTTLADLQKTHQAAMDESAKVSDAAKAAAAALTASQKALTDFKTDYLSQLATKEGQRGDLATENAALQKERADDAAARHAMMLKLSLIAGGLALACVLGVIYSPIGKEGLAIFGAVCGFASVGIWYITGPVVLAAVCVAVVGLAGWGIYRHNASNKTVVALTSFLHEKGQLADADLQQWMTRYVKAPDGSTTTVPDKAVAATINAALTATNKL